MIIAGNDEAKRSKIWRVVTLVYDIEYWRDEPEMSPASAAELLHIVDNKHSKTSGFQGYIYS